MSRRIKSAALHVCLTVMVYSPVIASPSFYTLGGVDQLLPFSSGGWGETSSVVAMNPAGLPWVAEKYRQSVGLLWVHHRLQLSFFDRPSEADVPDSIYQARSTNVAGDVERKPLPTSSLAPRSLSQGPGEQVSLHLGWSAKLIGALHAGVTALIPLHRFELQAPRFVDERAQYFGNQLGFERWGDTLEGLSAAAGVAHPIGPYVSLGLGVNLSTHSRAQSDVFLGDVNYGGISYVAPRVEVNTAITPFASIEARVPVKEGTLGVHVSAHAAESTEVKGEGEVQVWGFPYPEGEESIPQRFQQVYRHLPLRGHAGLSWRQKGGTGLVLGLGWGQWSRYIDRSGERADWSDQWDVNMGVAQQLPTLGLGVGVDMRWRPSPAPEQIGRTSYIDPDQVAGALSVTYELTQAVSLRLQGQAHRLLPRVDRKNLSALTPVIDEFLTSTDAESGELINASQGLQSNNPGYPGYESEGWVWVAQLGISITR